MEIMEAVGASRTFAAELFEALRRDGADEPGVTRDPYGAGEQRAHATVEQAARALGLVITRDAAANLYMTWPGRDGAAPRVIIGSHLDSVPHGGNFDGAAGVVAGLVAVDGLRRRGLTPARDLTIMATRAEESVWFAVSYIGSRAALGALPDGALQARRRDTERTLEMHMRECGGDPGSIRPGARHLDPGMIAAFLELHIEQAPSLIEAGKPVAICTGIPGNVRFPEVRIEGLTDHVGLPRRFRRDAALAGAEFFTRLDAIWAEHDAKGVAMACTVGRFFTDPATHGMTVIPGAFRFSLDMRAYDERLLAELERTADAIIADVERRRSVRFHVGERARAAVGHMDGKIMAELAHGAGLLGLPTMQLGSPASHDAAAFAAAGVPAGMLLIRNQNGSHNPHEAMEIDDFLRATTLLAWWAEERVRD